MSKSATCCPNLEGSSYMLSQLRRVFSTHRNICLLAFKYFWISFCSDFIFRIAEFIVAFKRSCQYQYLFALSSLIAHVRSVLACCVCEDIKTHKRQKEMPHNSQEDGMFICCSISLGQGGGEWALNCTHIASAMTLKHTITRKRCHTIHKKTGCSSDVAFILDRVDSYFAFT
jgi:hypothetical protein